jgi:hypothetical protein
MGNAGVSKLYICLAAISSVSTDAEPTLLEETRCTDRSFGPDFLTLQLVAEIPAKVGRLLVERGNQAELRVLLLQ